MDTARRIDGKDDSAALDALDEHLRALQLDSRLSGNFLPAERDLFQQAVFHQVQPDKWLYSSHHELGISDEQALAWRTRDDEHARIIRRGACTGSRATDDTT